MKVDESCRQTIRLKSPERTIHGKKMNYQEPSCAKPAFLTRSFQALVYVASIFSEKGGTL